MLKPDCKLDKEFELMTFKELAKLAGFEKNLEVDTLALAQFFDVNEQTIKRWIKFQIPTKQTVRLLKLKILLIKQENWIEDYQKYEFIQSLLDNLTEHKIRVTLKYSDIKKKSLSILINLLIKLYKAIDK